MTPEASIRQYPAGCLCHVVCRRDPEGDILERIDTVFGCWSYGYGEKLPDGRRLCHSDDMPCDAEITVLKYPRLKTWWLRLVRKIKSEVSK